MGKVAEETRRPSGSSGTPGSCTGHSCGSAFLPLLRLLSCLPARIVTAKGSLIYSSGNKCCFLQQAAVSKVGLRSPSRCAQVASRGAGQ